MTDRLLEEIVHDMDKDFVDSKSIKDRFVEVGNKYINQADDPTTRQIRVLVDHFEEIPSDEIDENALALQGQSNTY